MTPARMLYADARGRIYEHPYLEMVGASAGSWQRVSSHLLIPLPVGSELFVLPGRLPVGFDRRHRRFRVVAEDPYRRGEPVQAVAAFMAPAHTQVLTAAYQRTASAPVLPLFSYTAAGWVNGGFVVAGVRVDPSPRQDADRFDQGHIERQAREALRRHQDNRLIVHLGRCALTYGCPAAKNYFLRRWEAPLPTSPQCNAACLGCISRQEKSPICATQDRITFVPSPAEICEVAAEHLQRAAEPVASFGQGCEGEPLLQGKILEEAVDLIRRRCPRGTLNLNTNGSLPQVVARLRRRGLDSIRVSINSLHQPYYERYYRPRGYGYKDVLASLRQMKEDGGFASINLLTLPGLTDEEEEVADLIRLIDATGLDMIQWRNLNIDPEWYLENIGYRPRGRRLGIIGMMEKIRRAHPQVRFGYFNPCLESS